MSDWRSYRITARFDFDVDDLVADGQPDEAYLRDIVQGLLQAIVPPNALKLNFELIDEGDHPEGVPLNLGWLDDLSE